MNSIITPNIVAASCGRKPWLILAPPLLLGSMYAAFKCLSLWLGPVLGYLIGFLLYWFGWCLLFPLAIIGWTDIKACFADMRPRLGRPSWLGALFLGLPVAMAYITRFSAIVRGAGPAVIALSALIALVNASAEELLWRGVFSRIFPEQIGWGYWYPAVWFGLWHLAPQTVFPNTMPGGSWSLVAFAVVLGLLWGWVARKTRSIRWTTFAHFWLNLAGLGARIYLR